MRNTFVCCSFSKLKSARTNTKGNNRNVINVAAKSRCYLSVQSHVTPHMGRILTYIREFGAATSLHGVVHVVATNRHPVEM
ncbi:hypothetical protein J6590_023482 [Homalodisca vitripennis]|nr:hypothetical protein J6590_023482 [Homalodisca vitripennis]